MTNPALSSARNHQGRPWFGPGASTLVDVRVGPPQSRPRARVERSPKPCVFDGGRRPGGAHKGDYQALAIQPSCRMRSRSSAAPTPDRAWNGRTGPCPPPSSDGYRDRRSPLVPGMCDVLAPTDPQNRRGAHPAPAQRPATVATWRDHQTRPDHHPRRRSRRTIKQARALSRNRLVPGRAPRSGSLRKPRTPAPAPVAGPVVGFGSWSDPDPDAAADPDPPPGTRVLPGHHSRAGHSRARLNGQHPGRGPAPAGVRFATRPPRHSAEPRSSQRCWWADDPAGDRDCFWPGGVRGELMRIPTRCADGRGHPGGAPDRPDHAAGRADARTGDHTRRGGV